MRPLENIRVLDLTHVLSGPYATMILADLGAQVIKIEAPVTGCATRSMLANDPEHSIDGMGAYMLTSGRGKRSVALDMKSDAGHEVFMALVDKADVVVSNFRPGVLQRLRIDHASLAQRNPRIITAAISGFGANGPDKDRPAFDMVAQGFGGAMSLTGDASTAPYRFGVPIGDLGGGLFATIGILAALQARTLTGKGQDVDISMVDSQVSLLNYIATMYLISDKPSTPMGNQHFHFFPYGVYRAKDMDVIIACVQDKYFEALAGVLNNPILSEARFVEHSERHSNRAMIDELLTVEVAQWEGEALLARLDAQGVPCSAVNTIDRVLGHPQIAARNMVVETTHPGGKRYRMPGNPIKLSGTPCEEFGPPPLIGEHSEEVLRELLNMDQATISALKAQGVLG